MVGSPLPVLWICGASGAGKSAAAWALLDDFAAAGHRVAYVDIDQLGMVHPGRGQGHTWHHVLQAEVLDRLVPHCAAAGARMLVVSGVVDPRRAPRLSPHADLTLVLLSPTPATVRQRILVRGWGEAAAEEAVTEHHALHHMAFASVSASEAASPILHIDTTSLTIDQTAARLRAAARLSASAIDAPQVRPVSTAGTEVVVVTGARAAGSSSVGFGYAVRQWRAARPTAFADLQQLAFLTNGGRIGVDVPLGAANVATLHEVAAGRGAELFVLTAHLSVADRALVRAAFPCADVTIVRLRASERTLAEHVRSRVVAGEARLAGDDLLGADERYQHAVVASALADQRLLDASTHDDAVLDVDDRSVADTIAELDRAIRSS